MSGGYIFHPPSKVKARQWAAALCAAGIPGEMNCDHSGRIILIIPASHINAATAELAYYETVNCNWPPAGSHPPENKSGGEKIASARSDIHDLLLMTAAGLLLPIWHFFLTLQGRLEAFQQTGAATRSLIVDHGQWWRIITALTLHVDGAHLTANTVWGIMLGGVLALQTGGGGALLLGLLSGIGGNFMATLIAEEPRSAIGASTAVLGLIGILAGLRFLQKTFEFTPSAKVPFFSRQRWLALLGGLAALAFLGSAEHTDLTGHLAGFICGLLLAPAALSISRIKKRQRLQLTMLILYIVILTAGWAAAIVYFQ